MAIPPVKINKRLMPFPRVLLLASGTTILLAAVVYGAMRLASPPAPVQYLSAAVTRGNASLTDSETGEVVAAQTTTAVVPSGATIAQMPVELGQSVTAGQTLAVFNDPALLSQLATADAAVLSDQQQVSLYSSTAYQNTQNATLAAAQDSLLAAENTLQTDQNQGRVFATLSGSVTLAVKNGAFVTAGQTVAQVGSQSFTSPISGQVAQVAVSDGQTVSNGTLLMTLTSPSQSAKIYSDQSQVDSLQAQFDKLQAAMGQASPNLAQAKAQLLRDQQTYQADQQAVAGLTVKAPYAGQITALNASAGPGGKVMTVSSDSLVVTVPVPETQIPEIHVGQPVTITVPALPTTTFQGTVQNIAPVGNYTNGVSSFPITISIDHPENIRYGMSANVNIVLQTVHQALLIPLAALHTKGSHTFVEVLNNQQRQRIPVHVLLENATAAAVKSPRLSVGARVITAVLAPATGPLHLKTRGRALHHSRGGHKGGKAKP